MDGPCRGLRASIFLSATVVVGLALGQASALAQNAPIDHGGIWTWTPIDQNTCINRAMAAMNAVAGKFQLPGAAQNFDGWYVGLVGVADTVAAVHCIADDETANLVGGEAKRVLIAVVVATTRGFGSGPFKEFVHQCMQTGTCPQDATAPVVGNWQNPGGWGDVTITGGPRDFTGTYTGVCSGATPPGTINLRLASTPNGDRYEGEWRDSVCEGEIKNLEVRADGSAWFANVCKKGCAGSLLNSWGRKP